MYNLYLDKTDFDEKFLVIFSVIVFFFKSRALQFDGWGQHYPKCLYKVLALRIVLHSLIELQEQYFDEL